MVRGKNTRRYSQSIIPLQVHSYCAALWLITYIYNRDSLINEFSLLTCYIKIYYLHQQPRPWCLTAFFNYYYQDSLRYLILLQRLYDETKVYRPRGVKESAISIELRSLKEIQREVRFQEKPYGYGSLIANYYIGKLKRSA